MNSEGEGTDVSGRYKIEIDSAATDAEREALFRVIEAMLRAEEERRKPSSWSMTGRAAAGRGGIIDLRSRIPGSWTKAVELGWSGQRYNGRHGRGDAK